MANYAISASSISEGQTIIIRGKLGFARLTRLIDGEELVKSDERKVKNGMSPVGRPHTTATLTHAEVVFADPANPTREEQFVQERRYTSKKDPSTGLNYSIDSKGTSLPIIAIPSPKGDGTFDQDTSGKELAAGLDVSLVLRTYKPQNFSNRGVAIEQVVVNEPVRYYSGGGVSTSELASRGIVFNTPPVAVAASAAVATGEVQALPEEEDEYPLPGPVASASLPTATPAAAPVAAPAAPEETVEEKLARIEAENAALRGAASAVGENPWASTPVAPGISYQG